ncbi:Uncharacterized protein OBRU01_21714, partial [Operophtera brumata]
MRADLRVPALKIRLLDGLKGYAGPFPTGVNWSVPLRGDIPAEVALRDVIDDWNYRYIAVTPQVLDQAIRMGSEGDLDVGGEMWSLQDPTVALVVLDSCRSNAGPMWAMQIAMALPHPLVVRTEWFITNNWQGQENMGVHGFVRNEGLVTIRNTVNKIVLVSPRATARIHIGGHRVDVAEVARAGERPPLAAVEGRGLVGECVRLLMAHAEPLTTLFDTWALERVSGKRVDWAEVDNLVNVLSCRYPPQEEQDVKTAAAEFYKTSKEYLEQWCQFNNELHIFEWANLTRVPTWEEVQTVVDLLITQGRALNKKKGKSGQAAKKIKKWKYEDEMSFAASIFVDKKTLESLELTSDEEDATPEVQNPDLNNDTNNNDAVNVASSHDTEVRDHETIKQKTPQKKLSKKAKKDPLKTASAVLMSRLLDEQNTVPQQQHDELDRFFLNISDTVKKFSPYLQAFARNKILSKCYELYGSFEGPTTVKPDHLLKLLSNLEEPDRVQEIRWKGKILPEGFSKPSVTTEREDREMVSLFLNDMSRDMDMQAEYNTEGLKDNSTLNTGLFNLIVGKWENSEKNVFDMMRGTPKDEGYAILSEALGVGKKSRIFTGETEGMKQQEFADITPGRYPVWYEEVLCLLAEDNGYPGEGTPEFESNCTWIEAYDIKGEGTLEFESNCTWIEAYDIKSEGTLEFESNCTWIEAYDIKREGTLEFESNCTWIEAYDIKREGTLEFESNCTWIEAYDIKREGTLEFESNCTWIEAYDIIREGTLEFESNCTWTPRLLSCNPEPYMMTLEGDE